MKIYQITKRLVCEICTFRRQNKYLPLPHKLFKPGIRYYKDKENIKFLALVVGNKRIMFILKNKIQNG